MIQVGADEFCTQCMEWRTYDRDGKCTVCGKQLIKQIVKQKNESYGEYEREDFEYESETGG